MSLSHLIWLIYAYVSATRHKRHYERELLMWLINFSFEKSFVSMHYYKWESQLGNKNNIDSSKNVSRLTFIIKSEQHTDFFTVSKLINEWLFYSYHWMVMGCLSKKKLFVNSHFLLYVRLSSDRQIDEDLQVVVKKSALEISFHWQ
jgi:hypothetical protein